MAKAKKETREERAKRLARNAYSLQWKKDHAKKVRMWNRNWYLAQCEAKRKAA